VTKHALIEELEKSQLKSDIPSFKVGDTLRISLKIIEGAKERIQVFEGTVIARKGSGLSETVSLHRIAYSEGMERVFLLNSPRITKIERVRQGKVRRAKLYYLRGTSGKRSKVKGLLD
jgi:large subunit ribosomal protein L19